MADALRQLDPPIEVLLGPACGNRAGFAFARAVWAAKAGPFLGRGGGNQHYQMAKSEYKRSQKDRMEQEPP